MIPDGASPGGVASRIPRECGDDPDTIATVVIDGQYSRESGDDPAPLSRAVRVMAYSPRERG